MSNKIINIQTTNASGGKGISSFQIKNNHLIIRGSFTQNDIKEIMEIMNDENKTHSKQISVSNTWG